MPVIFIAAPAHFDSGNMNDEAENKTLRSKSFGPIKLIILCDSFAADPAIRTCTGR